MQGLIFLFIGLCGVALGIASWFALAFTPIESALLGFIVFLGGAVYHERVMRRRAEARLEKAVDDLGRLLSTDAQAGQVLSQRVKALDDLDLGPRLGVMEADMSVLGTVVRQVAESVSELEAAYQAGNFGEAPEGEEDQGPQRRGPTIPLDVVRRAIDDGRLVQHTQPIVTLPQRRIHAYDLVPRLRLEDGRLVDPPDYMPTSNAEGVVVIRRIERICAEEAVRIVRRARMTGSPVRLNFDISLSTLEDKPAIDQLVTLLAANRAVNPDICLGFDFEDWQALKGHNKDMLGRLLEQGVGLNLRNVRSLRLDFGALAGHGIRYIGVDATGFLQAPSRVTDFHSADVNDYVKRFRVNLVMTGITGEQQILALLEDGIKLAQGPHIAPPGPLRDDLREDDDDDMRRTAAR